MTKVHAVRFHAPGGPEVLTWEPVDLPPPGAGEARVRHAAIGVNFIDVYHRSGLYAVPLPAIPGSEAAGVVEAVGPGASVVAVGDRVAYATAPIGSYAEARNVPAAALVKIPDGVDDRVVAASLLKGMTVEFLVQRTYAVKRGDDILVHAAAGGVGTLLCQWAKHLGANVIGTVGSDDKADVARANGADHVIFYRREDVARRVREITNGRGVAVAYDGVGKDTMMASLDSLRRRGLYVSFGNASGVVPAMEPLLLSQKGSLFMTRPKLFDYVVERSELEASAGAVFDLLASGALRPRIAQTLPLREAARAHREVEGRTTTGATVLLP